MLQGGVFSSMGLRLSHAKQMLRQTAEPLDCLLPPLVTAHVNLYRLVFEAKKKRGGQHALLI